MDNADSPAEQTSAPTEAQSDAPQADANAVVSADSFHFDIEAGPILADILTAEPALEGSLEDLHAALASLPSDGLGHADIALEHLTSTVDLFDVPTDGGHGSDGG